MNLDDFKVYVKEKRKLQITSPRKLNYQNFLSLEFHNKSTDFFMSNASNIIESLRAKNWETFSEMEIEFSKSMYDILINEEELANLSPVDAIKWFTTRHPKHIYALSLSNTQSRRSRAGTEFEAMIELLLIGANIPFDAQGAVGGGIFNTNNFAKLVDCVSPGTIEYYLSKRNTFLISAKTTLRERWQEVSDEMARTMAREMFLVTLDKDISAQTISLINEKNIILVTTKSIKDEFYNNSSSVITFEDMLIELRNNSHFWDSYAYPYEDLLLKITTLEECINNNAEDNFICNYYSEQLSKLRNHIASNRQ